jgi:hypothetical protein
MAPLQTLEVEEAAFRFCMKIYFQNTVLFICEESNFLSNGAVYIDAYLTQFNECRTPTNALTIYNKMLV